MRPLTASREKNNDISAALTGSVIGLGLISTLLPVPRALAISNQPWVAELVISILLLAGLVWLALQNSRHNKTPQAVTSTFAVTCVFILWSFASTLWASSSWAALHHTFEWTIYLGVLAFSLSLSEKKNGYRSILYGLNLTAFILLLICVLDFSSITDFASSEGTLRIRYGKFGEMAAAISPVLAGASLYARSNKSRLISTFAWLCAWVVVMLSLSKGAFIAGILGHSIMFLGVIFVSHKGVRSSAITRAFGWLVMTVCFQLFFAYATSIPATTSYITGSADKTRGTSEVRVLTWEVGWMLARQNLVLGVGADNFGSRFNEARAVRPHSAHDVSPEIAEDYVVERSHNEPLQILAELGCLGLVLFASMFAPFAIGSFRDRIRRGMRLSPILWAAIGGMAAFAASSMVSSFSFRVVQNGAVFFLIFAIALNETAKANRGEGRSTSTHKYLMAVSIGMAAIAATYFGSKAIAENMAYRAERSSDINAAQGLYQTSLRIDPDNSNARYFYSSLLFASKQPEEAATELRRAIDRGLGVSVTYGLLAKYQEEARALEASKKTYDEALRIFPNSVYLRVAHACFLERTGQQQASDTEMQKARAIDRPQANGWYLLISRGSVAAYLTSQMNTDYAPPASLLPPNAVNQYVDDPHVPRPSAPPTATP